MIFRNVELEARLIDDLLDLTRIARNQLELQLRVVDLHSVLRAAIEANPPPIYQNRQPKIYFATQVGIQPPTVVLFCSNPTGIPATYRRYLLGVFRERLPFHEVPIKLYLRRRHPSDERDELQSDSPGKEKVPAR